MARGVTDQFLRILKNERRLSVRSAAAAAALSLVAYFMAELTDEPFFGGVVLLALGALALGLGMGAGVAWRRTQRYNASLRDSWNAWMRMSISCARVDEVARHVAHKPHHVRLAGVAWAALLVLNALLFAVLWSEASWGVALGTAVTIVNGLALGTVAGYAAWQFLWAGRFSRALDDLLSEGQIGLWGEV